MCTHTLEVRPAVRRRAADVRAHALGCSHSKLVLHLNGAAFKLSMRWVFPLSAAGLGRPQRPQQDAGIYLSGASAQLVLQLNCLCAGSPPSVQLGWAGLRDPQQGAGTCLSGAPAQLALAHTTLQAGSWRWPAAVLQRLRRQLQHACAARQPHVELPCDLQSTGRQPGTDRSELAGQCGCMSPSGAVSWSRALLNVRQHHIQHHAVHLFSGEPPQARPGAWDV